MSKRDVVQEELHEQDVQKDGASVAGVGVDRANAAGAGADGASVQDAGMNGAGTQEGTKEMRGRPKVPMNIGVLKRVVKDVFKFYPVYMVIVIVCLIVNAGVMAAPAIFMQQALAVVEQYWRSGDWAAASGPILSIALTLSVVYAVGLLANFLWNRLMAIIVQGSLKKFRERMFNRMQYLPIRYFDSHHHGDIMSYYTNDIDALRQMISQSLPQLLLTSLILVCVLFIMLWYSLWLTLVALTGVLLMVLCSRALATRSAYYFRAQQASIGKTEGYIEEMMNGQRVVQVFNHERQVEEGFNVENDKLFNDSRRANIFANIMMPILMNTGNVMYVMVAVAGGIFLVLNTPNVAISGLALSISVAVPFLNMTRQFAGQIGAISQQFNPVIMGMAGAERLYSIIDAEPEEDHGYVKLVNVRLMGGQLTETNERTGIWAWKHPHKSTGEVTFTLLAGDVELDDVTFGYNDEHMVLKNLSLHARPGEKVAFVGATGAGKTTITNLINRFYDIQSGKIRYDGINIEKIEKPSLRRSLGIVLQDVNLFTGTVLENIRYGRLNATDDECVEAAKQAGAHDFIERLPEGYNTLLTNNGSQLSQGQRQLISIARAAVADPPVMILDEATSSIDTRTEAIVQKGMDALMHGRTTFVIAHRLSTVRNSDLIIVLDNGHIVEKGNHDELIKQKGLYYQLYTGAFELE